MKIPNEELVGPIIEEIDQIVFVNPDRIYNSTTLWRLADIINDEGNELIASIIREVYECQSGGDEIDTKKAIRALEQVISDVRMIIGAIIRADNARGGDARSFYG